MLAVDVLQAATLFFAGMLAGFEVAVHYGFGSPPQSLTEEAQIRLRQAMVLRLRVLAPGLFVPTLICGVGLAVRDRHSPALWFHGVAIGLLLIWIAVRVVRTVPVNSATLEWSPAEPPADWREQVERTERFHVIAAWAAVIAFAYFLLPAVTHR